MPTSGIAHIRIDDADRYREYAKGFFPLLKAHGGKFVTYEDNVTVLEGERADGRTVIIESRRRAPRLMELPRDRVWISETRER